MCQEQTENHMPCKYTGMRAHTHTAGVHTKCNLEQRVLSDTKDYHHLHNDKRANSSRRDNDH